MLNVYNIDLKLHYIYRYFNVSVMNQSIPLVPWNNEQSSAIHNQTFLILLHRLGFHLPVDSGKLFVRIPDFWTADALFEVASRLGPIDRSKSFLHRYFH